MGTDAEPPGCLRLAHFPRSATCLPACRLIRLTWRPHRSGWLPLAPGAGTPSVHTLLAVEQAAGGEQMGFSARHLVDRGRLRPSGPRRKSRARGRWHDEVRIGQIRAIDASQARALPGSIVISILDGSIASTSQPSTKLSRISSCRMRRGPQSPGSRSLKHSM